MSKDIAQLSEAGNLHELPFQKVEWNILDEIRNICGDIVFNDINTQLGTASEQDIYLLSTVPEEKFKLFKGKMKKTAHCGFQFYHITELIDTANRLDYSGVLITDMFEKRVLSIKTADPATLSTRTVLVSMNETINGAINTFVDRIRALKHPHADEAIELLNSLKDTKFE